MKVKIEHTGNLLPHNGKVFYIPGFLSQKEQSDYFMEFFTGITWEADRVKMFGKEYNTNRKVAWYGDDSYPYTYSGQTRIALPWKKSLKSLKADLESRTELQFNSCLLNLYHTGNEGMSWHSDDEAEMQHSKAIASVSLGAGRRFLFRHKVSGEKIEIFLDPGSLLLMLDETQVYWQHALPKMKNIKDARINLTFRNFVHNT